MIFLPFVIPFVAGVVGGAAAKLGYDYLTGDEETIDEVIDALYLEKGPEGTAKFLVDEEWCDDHDKALEAVEEWELDNEKTVALFLKRKARKVAAREEAKAKAKARAAATA